VDIQFGEHALHVTSNGVHRETELLGDFHPCHAGDEVLENVALAGRKACDPMLVRSGWWASPGELLKDAGEETGGHPGFAMQGAL
jgi:hypothetical protein